MAWHFRDVHGIKKGGCVPQIQDFHHNPKLGSGSLCFCYAFVDALNG